MSVENKKETTTGKNKSTLGGDEGSRGVSQAVKCSRLLKLGKIKKDMFSHLVP